MNGHSVEKDDEELRRAERVTEPHWWHRRLIASTAAAVIALIAAFIAWVVYAASDVLFLTFLGIAFGVYLRYSGRALGKPLGGHTKTGVALSLFLLLTVLTGIGFFLGDRISSRVQEAATQFDESLETLKTKLKSYPILETAVTEVPVFQRMLDDSGDGAGTKAVTALMGATGAQESGNSDDGGSGSGASDDGESNDGESNGEAGGQDDSGGSNDGQSEESDAGEGGDGTEQVSGVGGRVFTAVASFFRSTLGVLTSIVIVFFLGVFFAYDPSLYRDGAARLLPEDRQERFKDLCNDLGDTLWHWLGAQMFAMTVTGVGVGVTMWLLGVPLPVFLGGFTGLMCFVPNIGAAVSVVAAMLLALPQGLGTVAAVFVAYCAFQALESNVLTPLVQKKAVSTPPALLLANQLLFGVLFGLLGVLISTPLLAVMLVLIDRVYVQDEFDLMSGRA